MPDRLDHASADSSPAFMAGDGEAARLMRATDWAATELGPANSWPPALCTMVGTMLNCRVPMFLFWGPALVQFYNDAYIPSFGRGKHPQAMGQRGADCWPEIWPIIWPQIDDVMQRRTASLHSDQLVPIFRNGRIEDVYWSYGYSPVIAENGSVGGTLVVCSETTASVLANRRQHVLRGLSDGLSLTVQHADVPRLAADALRHAAADVPACLHFRWADAAQPPTHMPGGEACNAAHGSHTIAAVLQGANAHFAALTAGEAVLLHGVFDLPGAQGPERVTDALLVAVHGAAGAAREAGGRPLQFVAFGLNPRLPLDADHRQFLAQLAESMSLATTRGESASARRTTEDERDNLLLQAPLATALLMGRDMVFQLANPLYCRIVGRSDLIGRTYAQAFPELVDTPLPGILQTAYRTGVRYVSPETLVPLDMGDGNGVSERWFEFTLEPLRSLGGNVHGLMAVAVDVSAQVQARQVLERSNAERQRLLDQAQSASRAKDEFLAMLGHELRNPLAPIVSALYVMGARKDSVTQREQAVIQRQVNHLVRLVDDLMDVASIARGKVKLQPALAPVAQTLGKAVEMVRHLFEQRGHALHVRLPTDGVQWWGDAARLIQVVANLLTNAARYTPPRGTVWLDAAVAGGQLTIEVRDTGMGIAPEVLPHVFDTFYQGERGVDRAEGGLGLGLALVRNLVSLHGGTAQAFSDGPGTGSRFVVTLPMDSAPAAAADGAALHDAAAANGKRVLIVDDNRDAAEVQAELLRLEGHQVLVAYDPQQALGAVAQFQPQVALLDIGLPGMDGHALAQRLRALLGSGCKLVALSGYGQASDLARGQASGFAGYLVKPVDAEALLAAIR